MKYLILTAMVGLVLSWSAPADARYKRKRNSFMALTGTATNFGDLQRSESASGSMDLESSGDIELALRIRSLFQLIFIQQRSTLRQSVGAGFRVDVPGFFLMGINRRQLTGRQKNYPVNTSIYGYYFQADTKPTSVALVEESTGSDMGFTVDTFLFNNYVYLRLQSSVLNQQGNTYYTTSAGLGVEF